ncbi:MAG TPA: hypothetical protein VH063_00850 [Gaiellaceae bacterium]|jgi:hypothetical protein|nr:hypothetical protein [Gaiellaceae bacterium]
MSLPSLSRRTHFQLAAASFVVFALALALAAGALAMGSRSPWQNAQVGLDYALYQPSTTMNLNRTAFKTLSCGTGQNPSVFATYGNAYAPQSNFGKVKGFSIAEGSPQICSNAGIAKYVATKTVNGLKVRVSVYCDPMQFSKCTLDSGIKNGYVLQWTQPSTRAGTFAKSTKMFMDSSRLTLKNALTIAAGARPTL